VADLSDVSTAFAEGEAVNVEEVMNLNPDVVFYNSWHAGDSAAAAKLEELGVACVGFTTDIPSAIESVSTWATLIGQVLGTEMQADKIVAYGQDVEKMVMDRVAQIPEEERRSALILANYNASGISAAGTTFGRYWLATIGAENVALELTQKVAPVSLEQIYAWDPEYIFLNSFSAFTAEDLMTNNAIAGHDWSGLTAVQNGHVYKMPLGMYYWFAPCSDSPLALQWLAKHLYPEQFTDIDMDAEIKDYFKEFYGVTLSDEDLHTLYNPPAESAM
jgi:iron complex transport system substrate-binding protein